MVHQRNYKHTMDVSNWWQTEKPVACCGDRWMIGTRAMRTAREESFTLHFWRYDDPEIQFNTVVFAYPEADEIFRALNTALECYYTSSVNGKRLADLLKVESRLPWDILLGSQKGQGEMSVYDAANDRARHTMLKIIPSNQTKIVRVRLDFGGLDRLLWQTREAFIFLGWDASLHAFRGRPPALLPPIDLEEVENRRRVARK